MVDALIRREGLGTHPVWTAATTPSYVHDRRRGERRPIAATPAPQLTRHEIDDLYDHALALALSTGLIVVTGRPPRGASPPVDFYRRLGADLAETDVHVVADLHGPELAVSRPAGSGS